MFSQYVARFTATVSLAVGAAFFPGSDGRTLRADDRQPVVASATSVQTYVGTVKNAVDSARIGIVADGSSYILYLCSQDEAFNKSSARWSRGTVANGTFDGKSPDGAMTVRGTIDKEKVEGTVVIGGKEMPFTAKLADERTYAGLYRCEEKNATSDFIAGWIVDEDDSVAGAVQNRQNRQISNPPGVAKQQKSNPNSGTFTPRNPSNQTGGNQFSRGGNQVPDLNVGQGTGVSGQQVTDPKNPATGAGKKFTPADFQNQIQRISTNLEKKGGSPLLALTIHQVRRFLNGARPSGAIENRTFARLSQIQRGTLADYLKDWDKIPKVTRDRILGPRGSQADPARPLTADLSRLVLGIQQANSNASSDPTANLPKVRSVRFTQFKCEITADQFKDEVFYTCLVASGTTAFDNVSDIYKGIKRNDVKNFTARDSQFWPRFNTTAQATSDISIGVGLYDDDSGIRRSVVNLLTGLGDVAGDIAANAGQNGAAVANGFESFLEGSAAAIGTARFIGSDTIIVKPNKITVGSNGVTKKELQFIKDGALNVASYRFLGLQVN